MKLVTHNGRFHYDDLLSTAVLKKIYRDFTIFRTRDEEVIAKGDIVYDVGSLCNPLTKRFDHHQHTFNETFSPEYKYKLSSAGLIFKYHHKELFAKYGISHEDSLYSQLIDKVYKEFFLGADCADNGVDIYGDVKPRTIYDMVELFNDYSNLMSNSQYDNFFMALDIVYLDMDKYIKRVIAEWFDKYKILEEIIKNNDDYIIKVNDYYGCDFVIASLAMTR